MHQTEMQNDILVYGSYGFTGNLTVDEFQRRGLSVTLAGRNEDKLKQQSEKTGLPYLVFELNTPELTTIISPFKTVLNCAGPFRYTSLRLAKACVNSGINYLNVTGEFAVIEQLSLLDKKAQQNGCVVLPGAGFDVAPSDCLIAFAQNKFPGARTIRLCLSLGGRPSRGTMRTSLSQFKEGGVIRSRGLLTPVRIAHKSYKIDFRDKVRTCVSIPWGDISSAFYSTQIPNIEVYMAMPNRFARLAKLAGLFHGIVKRKPFSSFLASWVERQPEGPSLSEREKGGSRIYVTVNDITSRKSFLLKTPEAYTLTAQIAADAAIRVTADTVKPGFHTPSTAFGMNYIMKFKGVERHELVRGKRNRL
ncbi:MAG: saccharopine dehydrogenase NADP-binding domain-containing protein [Candidatus Cyclonatronum sp.]|uniref:saccharopine dehydrogenase family protein n=1 Tax=Cyclonatronum sp. TaxID=3024185 RepID=UPI0025C476BD|nr:saccharopine dehydrogenase NADP-binding domain-containing protein [Cyclonatronum sp.]MCH8486465.1 saccharopine dehydrogenase NADP-binding domain-containing protein [Cyclonatronum sp.]